MHATVKAFGQRHLTEQLCAGKDVLDVGSRNVNGGLREWVYRFEPATYFGIDLEDGPGVDRVCTVEEFALEFMVTMRTRYDIIICTEMLEHAEHWREAIKAMTILCKPNGHLLLTTRSPGFPLHNYPADYWRYERSHLERVMTYYGFTWDESIDDPDPDSPGVLMMLRRVAPIGKLRDFVMIEPHKAPTS